MKLDDTTGLDPADAERALDIRRRIEERWEKAASPRPSWCKLVGEAIRELRSAHPDVSKARDMLEECLRANA